VKLRIILSCVLVILLAPAAVWAQSADASKNIPHLEKRGAATQLVVDGKPLLMLAGELGNSTASSLYNMQSVWPRVAKMNLNTVLAAVSWDLVEPDEGKFDFTVVDGLIQEARRYNIHLVFLWFGSWKNGLSSYAPLWVKNDPRRFPWARNQNGGWLDILSTFGEATRKADANAFAMLMRHIRQVDGQQHTVVMMQVENEVGVRDATRDFSPAANEAFAQNMPKELGDYIQSRKEALIPQFRQVWEKNGSKTSGTWTQVFGGAADEAFMAWNYARYLNFVAAAGKAEYPIPMYANAWLNDTSNPVPGRYPSGGPVSYVHDLWRAGAPAIDFLAPDIYRSNFVETCAEYSQAGNPLFIPEAQLSPGNALIAYLEYNALGYSPFAFERSGFGGGRGMGGGDGSSVTLTAQQQALAQTYAVLNYLAPVILAQQGNKEAFVRLPALTADSAPQELKLGGFTLNIRYGSGGSGRGGGRVGRGGPGAGAAPIAVVGAPAAGSVPAAGGAPAAGDAAAAGGRGGLPGVQSTPTSALPGTLIICAGPGDFVFVGGPLNVTFTPNPPGPSNVSLSSFDQAVLVDGRWVPGIRPNGDETNHNRNWWPSMNSYGIYRIKVFRHD
jgi:hypothetical protein